MIKIKLKTKAALGLTGLGLVACSANAAVTASWDFEGGSPGNVTDSISSTVGTLNGGATTGGAAIAPSGSNSLNLSNGSNFDTNTNGGLGGTDSFTVLAFIETSTTGNATIFNYSPSNGATGGSDLRLFVQSNGDLRIEMSAGAGFNLSDAAWDLGDGNTHLIAAVFDNSGPNDSFLDVDLYVDGTLYNVGGGTDHAVNLGNDEILLGQDQLDNRPFVGLIDGIQVHNEALTLAELDAIATIPEPSSALLGGLGLLAFLRRRR